MCDSSLSDQVAIDIAEQAKLAHVHITESVDPIRALLHAREQRILRKLRAFTQQRQDALTSNLTVSLTLHSHPTPIHVYMTCESSRQLYHIYIYIFGCVDRYVKQA